MRKRRRPLKMVGGVFSQSLGTTGNPATEDTQNDARNSENHKDKKNGLRLIKVNELTHPRNHRCEKITDQGKQRGKNRSCSALKSSSFHKILWYLSRTEQENQHTKNSSKDNKIANFRHRKDTETILQGKKFHQLKRPQIAFLIHVTVVTKTRTTSKAETQACGLRT